MNNFEYAYLQGMITGSLLMTIVLVEVIRRAVFELLVVLVKMTIILVSFACRVLFAVWKAGMGAVDIFFRELQDPPGCFFDDVIAYKL